MRAAKYAGVYPRVYQTLDLATQESIAPGQRLVTQVMIDECKSANLKCRCEELAGLRPGLTLWQVNRLGAGCCGSNFRGGRVGMSVGWVCPVLDKIRRRLGH